MPRYAKLFAKINNKLEGYFYKYSKEKYGLFSNPLIGSRLTNHPSFKRADVVYIHWVQMGFLTLNELENIVNTEKKVVFVLHDMWGITGGCHHAGTCDQYKNGCFKCPILLGKGTITKEQAAQKKRIYSRRNVSIISPSKWLAECAMDSYAANGCEVINIPNYFDSKSFKPDPDKLHKRTANGNPQVKVISFAAVDITSVYKGFTYLKKALEYLPSIYPDQPIEIQMIGAGDLGDLSTIPYKVNCLGYLSDEEEMANALSISDLYVIPSIMENQPTIIIESLSCGVPVVGFKIGGIPDMIDHLNNGYLAEPLDHKSLAEGIKYCLENNLKGFKLENFQPEYVLDKHLSLLSEA
ncbi:glycosyltransferase [Algoriphagus halophilus]|uniref:glycosyltransferase n=1 Tax=Algoriphagus halophilus TaxID=226505 RepID=UPI00358FB12B